MHGRKTFRVFAINPLCNSISVSVFLGLKISCVFNELLHERLPVLERTLVENSILFLVSYLYQI